MSTAANLHFRQTQNLHFCFQDHGLKWLWYEIASDRKHDIYVNSYKFTLSANTEFAFFDLPKLDQSGWGFPQAWLSHQSRCFFPQKSYK